MRRSLRNKVIKKPVIEDSSSDSEQEKSPPKKQKLEDLVPKLSESSSDESDIGENLKSSDKIDLNSPFFKDIPKKDTFESIEKDIFAGVSRLTDSESELSDKDENISNKIDAVPSTSTAVHVTESEEPTPSLNFSQLSNYNKKLQEAKKHAEEYKAKKQSTDTNQDILNLLNAGESGLKNITLNSSDFESCDSEDENWEEIKNKETEDVAKETTVIPVNGVQITVGMPENLRKKKEVDMLAAVKRRLNRIRKENQVFVHKVHSLCWIAHGNYVNSMINEPAVMALALSLIPSEKCYPPDRIDLSYLEQTLRWFRKTVQNVQKPIPKKMALDKLLQFQISSKEAFDKRMLVFIFVALLRSLGVQARLVMNFVVEPLRPPASDLHSLSTKSGKEKPAKNRSLALKTMSLSASVKELSKCENGNAKSTNKNSKSSKSKNDKSVDIKVDENSVDKNTQKGKSNRITKESKNISKKKQKEKSVNSDKNTKIDKLNDDSNKSEGKKAEEINKKDKQAPKLKNDTKSEKNDKLLKVENIDKSRKRRTKSEHQSTSTDKLSLDPPSTKRSRSTNSKNSKEDDLKKEKAIKSEKESKPNKSSKKPKKEIIKVKVPPKSKSPIPQVDGNADTDASDCENLMQVDGNSDETPKPKKRPKRNTFSIPNYIESQESDEEFQRSPFAAKNTPPAKVNLQKLKSSKASKISEDEKSNKNKTGQSKKSEMVVDLNRLKSSKNDKKSDKKEITVNLNRIKSGRKVQLDVRNDIINLINKSPSPNKIPIKQKKDSENSDSDYVPEEKGKSKQKGVNVWAEVFLESEEKWISVDVVHIQVHCVKELYNRATHPVSYIVAWNNDNTLKDVTKRYCQNFNTATRKLRVDQKWWDETLRPFVRKVPTVRDREEDDEFERQQLEKPLPTSISEYKNHPLYVLKRHLLKFESIYPPDAPTLGFVRNEPVYSRSCVYTLHSRDIWLKHAKVVKAGEKPYKIVKARPKYDKLSNSVITDQLLEIFGPWQVQDYEPPTAENGIVPRNAFGNVELFKPCMLPKKTVHLQLPGLNKVARKLNIDCASAIVGFDFHGGWSHPTYDGFVVCEEFAETLIAAWHQEQEELERKENEKIEARVYGNWKKLIKGLLIRERLKKKYGFGGESSGKQEEKEHKKKQKVTFNTKKRR